MTIKIVLVFSTLLILLIGLSIQQTCLEPSYETYVVDAPPIMCQPSCYVTNTSGVSPCPLASTGGCICKPGYVRSNDQRCILSGNCPPPGSPCPTSLQEYKDSIVNPLCQKTCDNQAGVSQCLFPNWAACQCKSQYVRNLATNRCTASCPLTTVPAVTTLSTSAPQPVTTSAPSTLSTPASQPTTSAPSTQPITTSAPQNTTCLDPGYEYFSPNATPLICQPTCPGISTPALNPCPLPNGPGCVCYAGYLRSNDQRCVVAANCPPPGSPCPTIFQEILPNIVNPICQKTCVNQAGVSPCVFPNWNACQCKAGYVRNLPTNRCTNACPVPTASLVTTLSAPVASNATCPDPTVEIFSVNATPLICQPTCPGISTPQVTPCPLPNGPGCICPAGYVRSNDQRCVILANCPPAGSPCPTIFQEAVNIVNPICQPTCNNYAGISPCIFPSWNACQCKVGYVRNLANNRCTNACPLSPAPMVTTLPTPATPASPGSQPITSAPLTSTTSAPSTSTTSAPLTSTPSTPATIPILWYQIGQSTVSPTGTAPPAVSTANLRKRWYELQRMIQMIAKKYHQRRYEPTYYGY